MIIDWLEYEDKEHVMSWLLLEAMSATGIGKFGKFDSSKLDVRLEVNGIEVDLLGAMENLQSQLKQIEINGFKRGYEHAVDHVRDDLTNALDDAVEVMRSQFK